MRKIVCNISYTRVCFTTFSNTEKRVENIWYTAEYFDDLQGVWKINVMKQPLEYLIMIFSVQTKSKE